MTESPLVAQVMMPERGLFLVRCPSPPPPYGTPVVVALDYGEDVGMVTESGDFDPARHGARLPGYQLLRRRTAADEAAIAANETVARSMRAVFMTAATAVVPDLRVPYARLSLGRTRLFIRFVSEAQHPDLARPIAELRRRFGGSVNVWQMGPRDEVSVMGGLGPCGRACCCATWQTRYPARLTAERFRGAGGNLAQLNGTCGRFKCCLAFEDGDAG
ncbi:MAG: regulatory iron-sulfur-containing complex subunit RicT [Kiritimatiellia bacterium]